MCLRIAICSKGLQHVHSVYSKKKPVECQTNWELALEQVEGMWKISLSKLSFQKLFAISDFCNEKLQYFLEESWMSFRIQLWSPRQSQPSSSLSAPEMPLSPTSLPPFHASHPQPAQTFMSLIMSLIKIQQGEACMCPCTCLWAHKEVWMCFLAHLWCSWASTRWAIPMNALNALDLPFSN